MGLTQKTCYFASELEGVVKFPSWTDWYLYFERGHLEHTILGLEAESPFIYLFIYWSCLTSQDLQKFSGEVTLLSCFCFTQSTRQYWRLSASRSKKEHAAVNHPLKQKFFGFSSGSVVKNLTVNAWDVGSIPDPGRSHMTQNSQAHGPQLLSLSSRARGTPPSGPTCLESMGPKKRKQCNEKPVHFSEELPPLATTGEKPKQQQRPSKAKNKYINN